jgi:hypothetical protein
MGNAIAHSSGADDAGGFDFCHARIIRPGRRREPGRR